MDIGLSLSIFCQACPIYMTCQRLFIDWTPIWPEGLTAGAISRDEQQTESRLRVLNLAGFDHL